MLTTEGRRERRPQRSLRSEYQEFIDQRIEEYKDALPREEILAIGDEAVLELAKAEQFLLTELVLRDQVDAIIRRRLKLPSYRKWRDRHVALRAAQAQAGHWGLAAHEPIVALTELIEDQDPVLVIGATDGACPLFLAARGANVTVADGDIAAVLGLEQRAMAEALRGRIECEVVTLGSYAPEQTAFVACVLETGALADLKAPERAALVQRLKEATPVNGRHVVMPGIPDQSGSASLSSDALRSLYTDWEVVRPPLGSGSASGRRPRNVGFTAIRRAERRSETPLAVSN